VESGYFVVEKPGVNLAYRRIETFRITPVKTPDRRLEATEDGTTEIVVQFLRDGLPVSEVEVDFARLVVGIGVSYRDGSSADGGDGVAVITVDEPGYYAVRTRSAGDCVIGEWGSIPRSIAASDTISDSGCLKLEERQLLSRYPEVPRAKRRQFLRQLRLPLPDFEHPLDLVSILAGTPHP